MDRWKRNQVIARRRKELRDRAVAYLGGSCRICGYAGCTAAFDFHHVEVWRKDFTISDRMTTWAAIEPELKKCILLCARCHREVHDGLHPQFIEYEDRNVGGNEWDDSLDEGDAAELADPPWPAGQLHTEHVQEPS